MRFNDQNKICLNDNEVYRMVIDIQYAGNAWSCGVQCYVMFWCAKTYLKTTTPMQIDFDLEQATGYF